ncbi:MAG TPA: FUSC family protein [Bryobacteraceae bacterium]|nr:FUSC family protein [Bryobacteraceae bacterium]
MAARSSFWDMLIHFDRARLSPVMATRNAIGLAIPLVAGTLLRNPAGGVLAATGALNVAVSDGTDPYRQRARRMFVAACLVAIAVFAGRQLGNNHGLAILLEALCAFAAGLLVAAGQTVGDIGAVTLVTLIVFSATPAPFGKALSAGLLALAGGVLQTGLSLAMWPIRRYGPERRVIAALYSELARSAAESSPATAAPPATEPVVAARNALAGLAGDRSIDAERCRALFSQAERIRLALLALHRLRTRMARDAGGETESAFLGGCLQLASQTLKAIAASLQDGGAPAGPCPAFGEMPAASGPPDSVLEAMRNDSRRQLDALEGQLRSAVEMAGHSTMAGLEDLARQDAATPWRLRVAGTLAVLQANLSLASAAFRHGIRLAACVAVADLLARSFGWSRGYWAAMTVALVLKPDFTATYTRGMLRLAGTFAGLGLATALVHLLTPSHSMQAALITLFVFLMRWAGPANYGVLVTALTGLVVFLFALSGLPAGEVIAARAVNTVAGGVISLTAYRLWPTWERTRISESLAVLYDAYREYLQTLCDGFLHPGMEQGPQFGERLSRVRQAGRVARTNLEASAARLSVEPATRPEQVTAVEIILADSHRFIHAVMSLEAGLFSSPPVQPRDEFRNFVHAVDATLYFLSAYLRGSSAEPGDLSDLRALHGRLVHSGDPHTERYALVNVETDRITNSLNSLAVETLHWAGRALS